MARILVIDDEHNIRLMVRLALQHVGHTVETAADGPDGLTRFADGQAWDLVLLDQRMPGMEGIEVLRCIRELDPAARVIMITAFGTVDLAVNAMRLGARDLLRKPFTADMLRGAVAAVLQSDDDEARAAHGLGLATVNGFRVQARDAVNPVDGSLRRQTFRVRTPSGEVANCTVELAPSLVQCVDAYVEPEGDHTGTALWGGLCEEVLTNYLWQNAQVPTDGLLRADDLTGAMRRWLDTVLGYGPATGESHAC